MSKLADTRTLVIAARMRAARVMRFCDMIERRQLTQSQHQSVDSVDCDLELCCARLGRIAEDLGLLPPETGHDF